MTNEDFYLSKSNKHIMELLNNWPKWEKNFLNINGEKFSGKSHLVNIFLKKFRGIRFDAHQLDDSKLKEIKIHQNIVLENLDNTIDEKLFYTLFNMIDLDNKYLIVTSYKSIVDIEFKLNDLNSRAKNFLLQSIEKPDDWYLHYWLKICQTSDFYRKKLINYVIKNW